MSALKNWQEEKRSAYLYNVIAAYEKNAIHKKLFQDLSRGADQQAAIWEKSITAPGESIPHYRPDIRTRFVAKLAKIFGTKRVRFILSGMKVRGMSIYLDNHPLHENLATSIPDHESRHQGFGTANNLRAAVFGVNDGLISNLSLILGVAAAQANPNFIILSGIAGLLAGAFSMAAGEYISVRSQREFFEYQIALEKSELEEYPEEEMQELALIYAARGLPQEDAEKIAKILINDPKNALDTLAREELGLNPNELGSPIGAAVSSFISFAFGAAVPLIPFLCSKSIWNLQIAIVATGTVLFLIGALLSLYTSKNSILSGLRMLAIGAAAGAITYAIGHGVGIWMGG